MTQILVTTSGVLTPTLRKELRHAGVIAIEVVSLSDVRLLNTEIAELPASELLYAAVRAANYTAPSKEGLGIELLAALDRMRERR